MPRSRRERPAGRRETSGFSRVQLALVLTALGSFAWAADPPSFVGTWSTTYGQMVLSENGGTVSGTYGGRNGITGRVSGTKYTFTYYEPGVKGEGEFELSPDGQSFAGRWRADGQAAWSNWTGKRAPETPQSKPKAPTEDTWEEPKPLVYRYGNLPQGLPPVFTEGDTDKDGQIGLYEWVKYWDSSEAKLAEFKALDLNGDGILTVEEYLRATKGATTTGAPSRGGQPGGGPPPSLGNPLKAPPPLVEGRDPKQVPGVKK